MPDAAGAPRGPKSRAVDRLARWGLAPSQLWRIGVGFLIGVAGAVTFLVLKLPLPWFMGSLTFCLIAAVLHAPIERPRLFSVPMRVVLGLAIGAAFSPALLGRVGGMVGSLLILLPFMALITVLGTAFFERFAGFERPTAFFCAVPGGLTDMVTMAADAGANPRSVTLVQATRIVMLVAILPFWLQWFGGHQLGGVVPRTMRLVDFPLIDAVVLVALGWAGWRLAKLLRLAGAPIIGPMILSGIAHAAGLTTASVPLEVLIFAQVTLGILLGAQFRGLTLKELANPMLAGIVFALVLLVVTAAVVLLVARLTGFDSTTLLLAYAPGGQTELNLIAYILGLDVAFTALHHLVRLAIVIFGAQIVLAANKSWRKGGE